MKITKQQLKQIIKEEIEKAIKENPELIEGPYNQAKIDTMLGKAVCKTLFEKHAKISSKLRRERERLRSAPEHYVSANLEAYQKDLDLLEAEMMEKCGVTAATVNPQRGTINRGHGPEDAEGESAALAQTRRRRQGAEGGSRLNSRGLPGVVYGWDE